MLKAIGGLVLGLGFVPLMAQTKVDVPVKAPVSVPTAAPRTAQEQSYRDPQFGVRFKVPPGWGLTKKDGEVSTFRQDARTAAPKTQMRSVASLEFNPYPLSTLSGALVYFSVERHAHEAECVMQTDGKIMVAPGMDAPEKTAEPKETIDIGGMSFVHGHDEHGGMCVEARDEIYTAYRKGSCYRFDLELNTFCAQSSGAEELSDEQVKSVEERMAGILSSVTLDWSKAGPKVVTPPNVERRKLTPEPVVTKPVTVTSGG